MKNKRLEYCPICGAETVVEKVAIPLSLGKKESIERCTGLIEIHSDKPLQACMWSQELISYYSTNNITSVSDVGIFKTM